MSFITSIGNTAYSTIFTPSNRMLRGGIILSLFGALYSEWKTHKDLSQPLSVLARAQQSHLLIAEIPSKAQIEEMSRDKVDEKVNNILSKLKLNAFYIDINNPIWNKNKQVKHFPQIKQRNSAAKLFKEPSQEYKNLCQPQTRWIKNPDRYSRVDQFKKAVQNQNDPILTSDFATRLAYWNNWKRQPLTLQKVREAFTSHPKRMRNGLLALALFCLLRLSARAVWS